MASDNGTDERPAISRRGVIGLLSGTAIAGLAGCSTDGDGTDQPTETTDHTGTTEPPGNGTTPTETPAATPTTTPTATPEPGLPDDPASLVSVDETQIQPVFPGAETTVSMTLENPYFDLELQSGEVSLGASGDGVSFGEPTGNTFETLSPSGSQTVEWPITVPETAGEYIIEVTETYSVGEDTTEITTEITVVVSSESVASVDASELQPAFPGTETTVSMTLENPYPSLELQSGEVTLGTSGDGFSFGEPTGNTFETLSPSGSQTVEWPVTVPETAGEYTLVVTETYSADSSGVTAEITAEITVVVAFDSVAVDASELQPAYPGETVTVTSTFENPYVVNLASGNVTLEGSTDAFGVTETTDPGFDTLEPGSTREGAWEVTVPEATGEYDMTATATASVNGQAAETTLQIPVTVSSIEQRDDEIFIPQTGDGVPSNPAFTLLPEGDDISEASTVEDESDLSAAFYFGYDADNLYLQAEVTDDTHVAKGGSTMWQNDNIQYAAGIVDEDEVYGPEDGISHVDGEAETWRWYDGNASQEITAVEATTSRDETNSLTTYEATIPWGALFSESKGPGDSFQFSVQVNEADSEGSDRKAVLGWTLPGINNDKTYGALGRFHLDDPDA